MSSSGQVTVAIADDFLSGFAQIPRKQQAKVITFLNKFRTNPSHPGIHYETIENARDPNLRSVRIDQTYRGIVLKPAEAGVYVLLWVDHHDEAYRWARNKACAIHPETGSLQVLSLEETPEEATPAAADSKPAPGLFDEFRDRHLTSLGVPAALLPLVRSLRTKTELELAQEHFPAEAFEALFFLSEGFSLEEVYRETSKTEEPTPVDVDNFEAALENPDSKRRFWVVEDEKELEEMLNAPLDKWRVFLHPSQRRLVENAWKGPTRVLGGAGTGKTVVAMHRARWLATRVFTGGTDRILVTTFTRNLAADIHENLKKICPDHPLKRIEVVNLDKWVSDFLQRNGYDHRIAYEPRTRELWGRALTLAPTELNLPDSFYREEWERVVQPEAVETLAEYKKVSRLGRGVRLNRKAREAVWPVFEEYRLALNESGLREGLDAMRDARHVVEQGASTPPYRAIIVDEAQDMGAEAFKLLRALLGPDESGPSLFIVGDAHQRIYRHKVVLSRCGIEVRGRSRKLRINYRTTEETRRWAAALLSGVPIDDLDDGRDDQKGYRSLLHGTQPELRHFSSFDEEVQGIASWLRDAADSSSFSDTCLVARTNKLLSEYEAALAKNGVDTYRVKRSEPEDRREPGLRIATLHRVKGLEFENVILAGANKGVIPLDVAVSGTDDHTVQADNEFQERALVYVASTRARRALLVTSFGTTSQFFG